LRVIKKKERQQKRKEKEGTIKEQILKRSEEFWVRVSSDSLATSNRSCQAEGRKSPLSWKKRKGAGQFGNISLLKKKPK
jgi:hypothetical protein